jgi:hypothetical protein
MERTVTVQVMKCVLPFSDGVLRSLLGLSKGDRAQVVMDRDSVFGPSHLASAFMHAARSLLAGRSRARDPSMEVLRWLSGSHQLVEGLERASPGPDTEHILICTAPKGWPKVGDGSVLPAVEVIGGGPKDIKGLEPVPEGSMVPWGGAKAARLLGGEFKGNEMDLEMAILELVAFTDLV